MTEKKTITPPIAPIKVAKPPVGESGAAVIETKPAIAPLIAIVTSTFPVTSLAAAMAPRTPPAAEAFVFKNTCPTAIASLAVFTAS